MRVVAVSLFNDGKAYKVPAGYTVNVSAKKPDGKSVYNPATEVAGNVAYITLTQQKPCPCRILLRCLCTL